MVCNFLGDEWFVDDLKRPITKSRAPWYVKGQVAGFVKTFDRITYTTIRVSLFFYLTSLTLCVCTDAKTFAFVLVATPLLQYSVILKNTGSFIHILDTLVCSTFDAVKATR